MFAVGHESGTLATAQHRVVHGRIPTRVRDERFIAQVDQRHHGFDGQPVIRRHREHQGFHLDAAKLDVLAHRGRTKHADIECTGAQLVALRRGEHVGLNLHRHARQLLAKDARDARQMREGGRPGQPDAEQTTAAGGDPADPPFGVVDACQDPFCLRLQEVARRREGHLPGGPVEQRDVEFFLELADRVRQRRLRDMQLLRRPPEWQVWATAAKYRR